MNLHIYFFSLLIFIAFLASFPKVEELASGKRSLNFALTA